MSDPKVSVIIPTFNRIDLVVKCVKSVMGQTYRDIEIIVVDDASTDGTYETLRTLSGCKVIRHTEQGGPGAARNTGVEASRGDLLVFLDSDCWASSTDWLSHHVRAHEIQDDCAVTGRVKGVHHTYGGAVDSYMNWYMFSGKPGRTYSDPRISMANVSVSRQVFDRIGPFRTILPVLEDVDWSYRATDGGIHFRLSREAIVCHQDREGLIAAFRHQRLFGYYKRIIRHLHPHSRYAWLYPENLAVGIALFIPLTILMAGYVIGRALPSDPQVLWYVPGIVFGQMGHCCGIVQSLMKGSSSPSSTSRPTSSPTTSTRSC